MYPLSLCYQRIASMKSVSHFTWRVYFTVFSSFFFRKNLLSSTPFRVYDIPHVSCSSSASASPSSWRDHWIPRLCGDQPDQRSRQHAEDARPHPHHYHRHVRPGGLPGRHLRCGLVLRLLAWRHVGQELIGPGELQLWTSGRCQAKEGQTQCTEFILRGVRWDWVHSCDFMTCRARRACTRLAVGISSRTSASRQAKRTASTLNSPDEGQVQEPMGGLDWSTLFSGAAVKRTYQ